MKDRDFVEYVVKLIVDHPDAVRVERKSDERGAFITLSVDPEDMGMVIGRQGATAKAIRTLLRVIGARNNAPVSFMINEPDGSPRTFRRELSRGVSESEIAVPRTPEKRTLDEVMDDIRI